MSLGRIRAHLGLGTNAATTFKRSFHLSSIKYNQQQSNLFGEITTQTEPVNKKHSLADSLDSQSDKKINKDKITLKNDTELQKFIGHEPTPAAKKYLSPLKQSIYEANVAKNGFFKNKDEIRLPNGEVYRLQLTQREIEALEPSMYLKSFRIKSSIKKATVVTKLLNKLNLKVAITQAHFNQKRIAREIGDLLSKGLKESKELNFNPDELFLDQIWAGKDGHLMKRLDPKGRGRTGVIEHGHIHIKAILKGEQTKKRIAWEKEQKQLRKKPYQQLPSESLRWRPDGFYRW
ncbi:54S ribosomal protein L22, mitochondrial [Wickerhamomyces ciferrii]|uniref:54S ribosomal protein L22, mitochondrial n=1 Tax=Wickerhamomyces ciferrii (strain ATCC 14091 / BCRC 22168 / CBS 111 / JCM 3599 / NBRC 0793 / NRRL Y-1031 F-60-10) TaxID=1206466 RepID=K0KMB1_WICCF|nr:54S ribosomal protein L22, mitochondrial [Wickerhamomyces ciferrii]CCH43327.1 54S ribosomal protein L22, mitochondrial [Wickerhamomyces ciferrii]